MRALLLGLAFSLTACGPDHGRDERLFPKVEQQRLEIWAHAGREEERRTLEAQIERFRAERPEVRVDLTWIPEGSYNGQVQATALAGRPARPARIRRPLSLQLRLAGPSASAG